MSALYARLKVTADVAERERKREADVTMPLTKEQKASVERIFQEATAPQRLVELEQSADDLAVRSHTVFSGSLDMVSLNRKTKKQVWEELYERVREHYAPFRVEMNEPACVAIGYPCNHTFVVKW